MKVYSTPQELIEYGLWDDYCEESGTSVWSLKEGLIERDKEIALSETLGLKLVNYKFN